MRILVISDIHNNFNAAYRVLSKHQDIKVVFFLGDGCRYIEQLQESFKEKTFHCVCGNCDFSYDTSYCCTDIQIIENIKIVYTHGHKFGVKYSIEELFSYASRVGAGLVLYGHTHISNVSYRDGIYLVNPGSVSLGRQKGNSYAIIDITNKGIVPNIIKC